MHIPHRLPRGARRRTGRDRNIDEAGEASLIHRFDQQTGTRFRTGQNDGGLGGIGEPWLVEPGAQQATVDGGIVQPDLRVRADRATDGQGLGGSCDVDHYATHQHPHVNAWLGKHPRFPLHFTPTSASWVNSVERFFRDITEERIRRGGFRSVDELKAAILQYREPRNAHPKPYLWAATPDAILAKVAKAKEALRTL